MYVVPGNSGIPKGMAVKRKLSGTVVGVGKVWGARRAGSSLALGPHSCHLSPHLPLSTCPQQREAQELEHITKGRVCDTPKFLESHEGIQSLSLDNSSAQSGKPGPLCTLAHESLLSAGPPPPPPHPQCRWLAMIVFSW